MCKCNTQPLHPGPSAVQWRCTPFVYPSLQKQLCVLCLAGTHGKIHTWRDKNLNFPWVIHFLYIFREIKGYCGIHHSCERRVDKNARPYWLLRSIRDSPLHRTVLISLWKLVWAVVWASWRNNSFYLLNLASLPTQGNSRCGVVHTVSHRENNAKCQI